MSYKPQTMFRIFQGDNHATAVMLKTPELLEVKSMGGEKSMKIFPSLKEWCTSYGVDEAAVKVNTDKVRGCKVVLPTDTGFDVPPLAEGRSDSVQLHVSILLHWYFMRMAELTPALLRDEEVKAAYNALSHKLMEYQHDLQCAEYYILHSYELRLLRWAEKDYSGNVNKLMCMPLTIPRKYTLSPSHKIRDAADEERVCGEIVALYKVFYDLIAPSLKPALEKYNKISRLKYTIQCAIVNNRAKVRKIAKNAEKIEDLQSDIQWQKASIAEQEAKIQKWQLELAALS